MLLSYIDLHTHSTKSDGILTPEQLVTEAEKAWIRLLALTDHNTATDITELQKAHPHIHLVQGSEMSMKYMWLLWDLIPSTLRSKRSLHKIGRTADRISMPFWKS